MIVLLQNVVFLKRLQKCINDLWYISKEVSGLKKMFVVSDPQ